MKNRKGLLGLVVTLVLLTMLVIPASPVAADGAVSIDPATQQQPVGASFTVQVAIDSVTDLDTAQYDVTFNSAVIQLTGANVTAGLIGGTTIPIDMIKMMDSNTVRVISDVAGTPPDPGATGSGYLSELHFIVVGAAGSSSTIAFTGNLTLGDSSNPPNEISATWAPGSVTIAGTLDADFTANATEVVVGETIGFTDATSGGSGVYDTYEWDFDNNASIDSTDVNPTYSYAAAGTYTVALTVTDSLSATDTETKTGYITVYDPLDAGFSADVTEALVGQTITFDSGTTTGGKTPYTYAWDFGDGTGTSTDANPTYNYSNDGTYTVTLTVTDDMDNENTEIISDYITIYPELVTGFTTDVTKVLVGVDVSFDAGTTTGGKTPYTYDWDFDDGGSSSAATPKHSFGNSGNYTVTLTVTDNLTNTDDITLIINVFDLGDANEDGVVDILDVTHIEHIIMEDSGYDYTEWADAKDDDVINVLDITATEWIILGGSP